MRPNMASLVMGLMLATGTSCIVAAQQRAEPIALVPTIVGPKEVLFDPKRQGCDGNDIPDAPLRLWRGPDGGLNGFGLHYENRRLHGPDIRKLALHCRVVFRARSAPDPKRYDDKSWIAATWTADGRVIHGLVHHEFQANYHLGRCSFPQYIQCWWNSVLAIRSDDGGQNFRKATPAVIAASADPSEVGQGRHRGFFNPSNIIEKDGAHYALIATTGWEGRNGAPDQPSGVCLFRNRDIADSAGWRAWDGKAFTATFPDPYQARARNASVCKPLAPLPAPVGSITRHQGSGAYIAVYQAQSGMPDTAGGRYVTSGLYASTSRDLITWSQPVLILATKTLYDTPCGADALRSYPSLVDQTTRSRNFESIGDEALLTWSEMRVEGCKHTHDRVLVGRRVRISSLSPQ